MKIKEVVATLERFAPLPLQEGYDNAGLQVGLTEADASGVLLCLDVTEAVIDEAARRGCNLVVSHHPLLFHALKHVTAATQPERCVCAAIRAGITLYAAHTNLDNAPGGVNHAMARLLGLTDTRFLMPAPGGGGSGLVGELPEAVEPARFLRLVKDAFGVACLCHNEGPKHPIRRVALCGGAGAFLADEAVRAGADAFVTGEVGYHHFFGYENELWLLALGHYQSERHTVDLLYDILHEAHPDLRLVKTELNTNPIRYMTD